ncbi:MAG: hypothetical protein AAF738_05890 [Bacteroidota bacterium]
MAKKQVIDIQSFQLDLEGFMEQAMGENTFSDDSPLLSRTPSKPKKKTTSKKKKSSKKSFAGNLNLLLEDALKDSIKEHVEKAVEPNIKRKSRKPMVGLDSLIRETVKTTKVSVEVGAKRQVTVLFEPENLQKLKTIARIEKSFLRDIVNDVLNNFINSYEQERGGTLPS